MFFGMPNFGASGGELASDRNCRRLISDGFNTSLFRVLLRQFRLLNDPEKY
jgi:hypothetical protein